MVEEYDGKHKTFDKYRAPNPGCGSTDIVLCSRYSG